MNKILCSTGTMIGRPNQRNYRLLEEFVPQLTCDGLEFMLYESWYDKIDEIVRDMKRYAFNIPVFHCEKHIGEQIATGTIEDRERAMEQFRINCHMARELGAEKMVLHLWNGRISDSHFINNLRAFENLLDIAEEYDIQLMVENVVCNQQDPMTHMRELRNMYPDITFTYDTKMAAFHNQIDLLYQEEWQWLFREKRIRHLHVNDYKGGYMDWGNLKTLHVGDGNIDFKSFFRKVNQEGYTGDITIEATSFEQDGTIRFDKLNQTFGRVRKLFRNED